MSNPAPNGDANPTGSDDKTPVKGSEQEPNDSTRKLQSERDKLRAELDGLRGEVDQLRGQAMNSVFEKSASKFLKENADKFPDVEADDLLDTEELTPEAFEKVAVKAQGKYDRVRNKAIADVQTPSDDSLTPEQAEAEIKNLRKETEETPQGGFQKYLRLKQRTRK